MLNGGKLFDFTPNLLHTRFQKGPACTRSSTTSTSSVRDELALRTR